MERPFVDGVLYIACGDPEALRPAAPLVFKFKVDDTSKVSLPKACIQCNASSDGCPLGRIDLCEDSSTLLRLAWGASLPVSWSEGSDPVTP